MPRAKLSFEIADARHPVVELVLDMVDPVMQRAAESDVDLLQTTANGEDGNALGDAFTDQRQHGGVAPGINRLVFRKGRPAVVVRLNIGPPAREKQTIETTYELGGVARLAHRWNEQRHRAGRSGDGADVVIACDVGRDFAFGSMDDIRRDADEGTRSRHVVLANT